MECVVGPFVPETAAKADDFLVVNGGAAGDDLFVDEFLDFSNDYSETEEQQQPQDELETKEQGIDENNESIIIMTTTCSASQDNNNGFSEQNYDFAPLPEPELGLHGEGLESLEWLSHFSEDSFPDYSLTGKLPANPPEKTTEPAEPVHEQPCFPTPVQTKARTKRGRTGVRVWPVLSHSSSSTTSSTSSTSSTTSFPATKKHKKRNHADDGGAGGAPQQPRRCSHCGVTKTPQWRAGPLGSKTLCNACGVRFKSGRLLPEYRPACSPTFSSELHSNNHRKVLEMRRKMEELETGPAGSF